MSCLTSGNGVWVFCEQRRGTLSKTALELLGEGRRLADERNAALTGILIGNGVSSLAQTLIAHGADTVLLAEHPALGDYTTSCYTRVLFDLARERAPEILLIGATAIGRDLAPRLAARLNTGLTADCTSLAIDPEDGKLLQTRPAFGGNLMATIITPRTRPQMATVRPGVMESLPCDCARTGIIESIPVTLTDADQTTVVVELVRQVCHAPELTDAQVIVTGGRGVGGAEGFALLQELADALGGVVGASRVAVDSGWIEPAHQVGQTGKSVRPQLYIACGVSGAIQHVTGMDKSRCIVAINSNPNAPIFKIAHYGICGDLFQVVPLLLEALRGDCENHPVFEGSVQG